MVIERTDPRTKEKTYGIEGVTMDGRFQLYPFETKAEAVKNEKLLELKNDPSDPRFKDPKYISLLKSLDRV